MLSKKLIIICFATLVGLFAVLACNFSVPAGLTGQDSNQTVSESIPPDDSVTEPVLATETEEPIESPEPLELPTADENSKINPVDGAEMVYNREGQFFMGTGFVFGEQRSTNHDSDALGHEMPSHDVVIGAHWFYRKHVTNAQFSAFVSATGYQTTAQTAGFSYTLNINEEWVTVTGMDWQSPEGPDSDILGLEDHPVVHVSWFDAQAYCEWAGGRLPTEAEWEKVARAPNRDFRRFPWGRDLPSGDKANFCDVNCPYDFANLSRDDGYARTSPVGSYPLGAGALTVYDMAGNVWDWVVDWFDENYYLGSPRENPTGPESGIYKVVRGGGWASRITDLRVTNRGTAEPNQSSAFYGFRCVLPD